MKGLAISEVAERTGIAAGTIRMWEQRFGFPEPRRTPSGYRVYDPADVDLLKRVASYRERGLSVPAALAQARAAAGATDRPSLFGAIAAEDRPAPARILRKRTMIALSRAIEDEALARAAGPVVFAAFQQRRFYEAVAHRYARLAERADAAAVFADFPEVREPQGAPAELPIGPGDALGQEWAVVIDAPGYAAALVAWELPDREPAGDRERRFEAFWTMDPVVVRRLAHAAAALAARSAPELGSRIEALLEDRPLAFEKPAPALEALVARVVEYLEASGG